MNSLILALIMFAGYIIAYHTYGKYISKKIFQVNPDAEVPAEVLKDHIDFVPTHKHVLFGHHYTSIAGLGPIVGPAIGIIWGWVPAVLWVLFGSIFIGAVHDFGALIISMRSEGRSIGDIASDMVNPRVRTLFLTIIFFALWIVIAVFALIIAMLFSSYPSAVFPVWFEIPIAVILGFLVYRKGFSHRVLGVVAVIIMYITVVIGAYMPLPLSKLFMDKEAAASYTALENSDKPLPGNQLKLITEKYNNAVNSSEQTALVIWIILLMVYAYIASTLPVQTLLQPRDYINSHQLLIAMGLLCLGVLFARPLIVAPAVNTAPAGARDLWPFLFVTIACGAVSGFHSLVSSGTSSKQCANEEHAKFVGYGGMLLEGALATLVIIAVAGGLGMGLKTDGGMLTGTAAFNHHYANWGAAAGLKAKLGAFVDGSANMLATMGIAREITVTIMGVFIVSFAATTLDSATRIQRYIVSELSKAVKVPVLSGKHVATSIAVITALVLAFHDGKGKGAMNLWPLFGATNQLLAGLTLFVITIYLAKRRKNIWLTFVPMVGMLFMTGWAMIILMQGFYKGMSGEHPVKNGFLLGIGVLIFVLEIWMLAESVIVFKNIYSSSAESEEAADSDTQTGSSETSDEGNNQ